MSTTLIIKSSTANQGVVIKFYVKCGVGNGNSLHTTDLVWCINLDAYKSY